MLPYNIMEKGKHGSKIAKDMLGLLIARQVIILIQMIPNRGILNPPQVTDLKLTATETI